VESLEDRAVPTVIVDPQQEIHPMIDHQGGAASNVSVYTIFWGGYWSRPTGVTRSDIEHAFDNVLNGPYLSRVQQYGSDGHAHPAGSITDPSIIPGQTHPDPPGFRERDLRVEVETTIQNHHLPHGNNVLYVVVTPPDTSPDHPAAGYHDRDLSPGFEGTLYAWVGGNCVYDNYQAGGYSQVFSHEVAETLSDPGLGSWYADNGNEIGDGEPDQTYTYLLANGTRVQPYWSNRDNAFVVADGNAQVFYLTPNVGNGTFQGNYSLNVSGGQLGPGSEDWYIVDTTTSGGVQLTLNGETVQFEAGTITDLSLTAAAGHATHYTIKSVADGAQVAINGGSSGAPIDVTVGNNGSLAGVRGAIDVQSGANPVALTVDDSADTTARTVTLSASAVAFGGMPAISYGSNSVRSVAVKGGSGGNLFTVQDTPPSATLHTGAGNDTVNVLGNHGALTVEGDGGQDTVVVGNAGSLKNVAGGITVRNANGCTDLTVNGSADTGARSVTLSDNGITGQAGGPISWASPDGAGHGVRRITVGLGAGNDTVTVSNTPAQAEVHLRTGAGANTVSVLGTRGPLEILGGSDQDQVTLGNHGSLLGIAGTVLVDSANRSTGLTVDDSADTTRRQVAIGPESGHSNVTAVTGLAPATIRVAGPARDNAGVSRVVLQGGKAASSWTLANTTPPLSLALNGSGQDTLAGPAAGSVWQLSGVNRGSVGSVLFTGMANLVGGPGPDTFRFLNSSASLSGSINGQGGGDWLDYSALTTSVAVNQQTGKATGVAGGVRGVQHVLSSSAGKARRPSAAGSNVLTGRARNGNAFGNGAGESHHDPRTLKAIFEAWLRKRTNHG
jgi:hypothetical protein